MYLLASSEVTACVVFGSRPRNVMLKPLVMSFRLVFTSTLMSLRIIAITDSIGSPRERSDLYRSYFCTRGSRELRLATIWLILLSWRVMLSSVAVGTTFVGSVDEVTTISVVDSYMSGERETTYVTAVVRAIIGRMISRFRLRMMLRFSPGFR